MFYFVSEFIMISKYVKELVFYELFWPPKKVLCDTVELGNKELFGRPKIVP